jgi:hypothetical protein
MKKLLLIPLLFLLINSFGQPIVNRAGAANTVSDPRLQARLNLFIPRYTDTTQANLSIGIDSCGAVIYTYDVDAFWVRQCYPVKHWGRIGSGGSVVILPQCGIANGTGIVTWDSLLVFDITHSVYAVCCDHVARTTPDTTIVLPAADPDNPRIDAIVLTQTGIKIDTGVAAANPALPQLDSCQLLLTYVLINAGQTVPAFVNANNPLVIYDEFATNEWDSLFRHNVSVDSLNTSFPIHLTHAALISNYTIGNNYFEFYTDSIINLNDYGALKFYIRENDAQNMKLLITWYLDDVPQTAGALAPIQSGIIGQYQTIVMPTTAWRSIGTSLQVNKIRISMQSGAPTSSYYLDWVQLQTGIPPVQPTTGTVTTVNAGNLNPLFNSAVTNPTSTPTINFTQQNAPANTVFENGTNASAFPSFGKLDLSTQIITGLLPINNIAGGPDGSVLTNNGANRAWTVFSSDTIYATNALTLYPDGNGNDTLRLGGTQDRNTVINNNGHTFTHTGDIYVDSLTIGRGGSTLLSNTALGKGALLSNTTGVTDVAVGDSAMILNTTGTSNTAVGWHALGLNTTAGGNTAIGRQALEVLNTTGFTRNTAVGNQAASGTTTGTNNTAIGDNAFNQNTTGSGNTIVGGGAQINSQVRFGSNNTVLGYNASVAVGGVGFFGSSNNVVIGANAVLSSGTNGITVNNNVLIADGANGTRSKKLQFDSLGQLTLWQYDSTHMNGGTANDSVAVITSTGLVKKRNAASFGGNQNLQQVTDVGNLTTNNILIEPSTTGNISIGNQSDVGFAILGTANFSGGFLELNNEVGSGSAAYLEAALLTANRIFEFPDADGTLALRSIGTATLDFASTNAQNSRDLTIALTGAALGDVVILGVPNGSTLTNSCFTAWVSSANVVTVRFNNYSSGALDPASGDFTVTIVR